MNPLIDIEELQRADFGHELKTVHISELRMKISGRRQLLTALKFKKYD